MGKKLTVLLVAAVTVGIFLVPKVYYEHIDTSLNENRQDYRYNVNIDGNLDFSEKREILLNQECLIDIENLTYTTTEQLKSNINQMINKIYFNDPVFNDEKAIADVGEFVYNNICFKLIYVDDEFIKILRIGTCIFGCDTFDGFAIYDAATYEVYTVYIVLHDTYWEGYIEDEWKSIFNAEEIINSKTINSILEKTLEEINIYFEDMEMNMLDRFLLFLKNGEDYIGEETDGIQKEIN